MSVLNRYLTVMNEQYCSFISCVHSNDAHSTSLLTREYYNNIYTTSIVKASLPPYDFIFYIKVYVANWPWCNANLVEA